jgi:hypothetical protein
MRFSVVYFNQVIERRPGFQAINRKLSALLEALPKPLEGQAVTDSLESASTSTLTFDLPSLDDSGSSTSGSVRSVTRSTSTRLLKNFRLSIAPDFFSEPANTTFLELDIQLLVNQLCHLDSQIYQRVQPRDFVESYIYKGKRTSKNAKTVSDNIAFFNRVSAWVSATILRESHIKNRVKVIEKFLRMALVSLMFHFITQNLIKVTYSSYEK